MTGRYTIACLVLVGVFAVPQPVSAVRSPDAPRETPTTVSENAARRQSIRQTPILERPDRVGHFYGNTVRRRHRRANGG